MTSQTDQIIRRIHGELAAGYPEAGDGEILDHLSWEVGGAASELVKPARWVGAALVTTGVCVNRSEAHARIARIVHEHTSTLDDGMARIGSSATFSEDMRTATDIIAALRTETPLERARRDAVSRMEREIGQITLPIHARLESCSIDELDQAAATMIELALEHGDPDVLEDVIVSLLIFSEDWGDGRWWDANPIEGI